MSEPIQEHWLKIAETFLSVTKSVTLIVSAQSMGSIYILLNQHIVDLCILITNIFSHRFISYIYFIAVDIGDYGKNSDSSIFKNSIFYQRLIKKELNIPENSSFPEGEELKLPFVIVGDEAFGLSQNLMRPYGGKHLSTQKKVFNYRLSRARRFIECTFGFFRINGESFTGPLTYLKNLQKTL